MRSREEKKKNKGQESTIGKIIYSFLLFLPLLAIGVTCGYAMFNKNAYQSFEGSYKFKQTLNLVEFNSDIRNSANWTQYNEINDFYYYTTTLNYYYFEKTSSNTQYGAGVWFLPDVNSFSYSIYSKLNNNTKNNTKSILVSGSSNGNYSIRFYNIDFSTLDHNPTWDNYLQEITNINYNFSFNTIDDRIYGRSSANGVLFYNYVITHDYVIAKTLSDVFYYSIDKVQQSPLFNWAENSIIYTTTATTCNALRITTPFIPLLMSYWLIISVIYFLYDIALMLVWIIHKKIHELQESI